MEKIIKNKIEKDKRKKKKYLFSIIQVVLLKFKKV